jgi:hypothetical protein
MMRSEYSFFFFLFCFPILRYRWLVCTVRCGVLVVARPPCGLISGYLTSGQVPECGNPRCGVSIGAIQLHSVELPLRTLRTSVFDRVLTGFVTDECLFIGARYLELLPEWAWVDRWGGGFILL